MIDRQYLALLACALACAGGLAAPHARAQVAADPEPVETRDADDDGEKCAADAAAEADAEPEAACDDEAVIVNGKRPLNRIDRQVYDTAKDPASNTGTTGAALEKLPGVNVTASGDVTLHGNSVEILVNGKPSPLFSGENRAAALQALPLSAVSSIEILSNPGAQYGAYGAGGIINIVTKKAVAAGLFGTVSGQVEATGGYNANSFVRYSHGPFSTTATLNLSDYPNRTRNRSTQAELDGDGHPLRSTDNAGVTHSDSRSFFGTATTSYDAGAYDTITGQIDVMKTSSASRNTGITTIRDASGVVTEQFESEGSARFDSRIVTAGLGWTRIGSTLGETLELDAKVTRETSRSDSDFLTDYAVSSLLGGGALRRQPGASDTEATKAVLSADYNGYVGDDQLSAGLQVNRNHTRQDTLMFSPYEPNVGTMVANPLLTNVFDYRQTISAAYVTYQKALGERWVVLGGVRVEGLDYESREAVSGAPVNVAYSHINPSVFATYVISDVAKLRFNYSRRLQRPTPYDLNPSLVYLNDYTVVGGTPALKPQEIDALEASYEYARLATNYSVRAYHLDNSHIISPVTDVIPDPQGLGRQVVLLSRQNAGSSRQTGVQLTYANSLSEHWSVNANIDAYTTDMETPEAPGKRSLMTVNSQLGINYTHGNNTVVLSYYRTGKQLTADGYSNGFGSGSLSWYRSLTSDIDLTVSVTDIFKPRESVFVRDTGDIRMVSASSQRAPIVYIGLSRRFASGSFSAPK